MDKLPRITVIVPFENEDGYQEIYAEGYLTSEHYAVYIEEHYREIVFVGVVPSRDPSVYVGMTRYLSLGELDDWDERESIVTAMTSRLKQMTAYDFLTDVMVKSRMDTEFDDLIVPRCKA